MAKEKTYKVFNAILYPDSTSYNCAEILASMPSQGCEWYAALHDKDINEDGTPKKDHYHLILRYSEGKQIRTVAKDLQLPESMIEKPKKGGFKGGVQYLIHQNARDKYQYEKEIIFGSGDPAEYLKGDADSKGMALMDAIYSGKVFGIRDLYEYAREIDAWSEFRRGFYMYNSILGGMRTDAIHESASRRSDADYEERRKVQAQIDEAREEIAWKKRQEEYRELPQESIPEFGEASSDSCAGAT